MHKVNRTYLDVLVHVAGLAAERSRDNDDNIMIYVLYVTTGIVVITAITAIIVTFWIRSKHSGQYNKGYVCNTLAHTNGVLPAL